MSVVMNVSTPDVQGFQRSQTQIAAQVNRVLARGQMTEAEFETILARQVPDSVKRARADFVIDTSQGFASAEQRVDEILAQLRTGAADGQDKTG
jgi:dephospho-CoA kinase